MDSSDGVAVPWGRLKPSEEFGHRNPPHGACACWAEEGPILPRKDSSSSFIKLRDLSTTLVSTTQYNYSSESIGIVMCTTRRPQLDRGLQAGIEICPWFEGIIQVSWEELCLNTFQSCEFDFCLCCFLRVLRRSSGVVFCRPSHSDKATH
jgi:hypothetical protein